MLKIDKNSAYLITDFFDRFYFSKVDLSEGYILLTENKSFYFTDARYFSALKDELKGTCFSPVLYFSTEDIKRVLLENKIERLGIDYTVTTLFEKEELDLFGLEIFDTSKVIASLKAIKSEEEIKLISESCLILEKSFYETLPFIQKGCTEKEIASRLERNFINNGAEGTSFETIVAFNENSAVPHHKTGNCILTDNSVILIDCGCKYKGYSSDFTRTLYFGDPNEEFIKRYNAVWAANELCEKLIKAGDGCNVIDGYAREYLENNGMGNNFTHSLGHGVGLRIHEAPTLSPRNKEVIKDGMVFTVEPGVYFDGEYGIRIEDTVVMENGRARRLFSDGKDLIKIK